MLILILLGSALKIEARMVEIFDFSDMVIDNAFNKSYMGKPYGEIYFPGMNIIIS
jgi:hypothetical protein